ncbi:MAG: hypothetical protein H0M93_05265 [Methanophagales archaeon]|nr:hypothetical protein [Methanophagales archaeon]
MSEEELIFQLLEEDRKVRTEQIVEDRKITAEDCLVIGILRLNRRIDEINERLNRRIDETNERIDELGKNLGSRIDRLDGRIDKLDGRIDKLDGRVDRLGENLSSNFRWTVGLIIGTWATTVTILITILLQGG